MHQTRSSQGSVLVAMLMVLLFMTTMLFALLTLSNANLTRARSRILQLQAQYAAESGVDAAIATLNSGNTTYTGTATDVQILSFAQYKSTYSISVANGSTSKERLVTAVGKVYSPVTAASPSVTRTVRVVAQRSTTTTASSMLSRNIIDVGSGVKTILAKDIYVNGFINMNKNTTDLTAENITVAGRNVGASNCSIGGTGNLVKPSTFSNPGQTKTKLNLAFNNCITPPGNTNNTNFDVSVNQTNISTVQSLYIPWSQYMDSSYLDAGSCIDWTSGGSTRQIPSVLGSKKTHYPDSGSNTASTCGTSGDVNLGSNTYTITDNAHIRANLCASSGCDPIFNNPSGTVRYIFVEGTVNFTSVNTPASSGPIVIIAYGTDPASKTSVCPYGGAVYLGQGGSGFTRAPDLYLLAMNGLCIDGTKFGENSDPADAPMLGGIAGKNLYVASSPSTPRPLLLDPSFPVDQIPIDLAWRAVRYGRL
ncbi:MAG: hypothetical protein ABIR37_03025 [Candidatus Saccharimonadales bacterium]